MNEAIDIAVTGSGAAGIAAAVAAARAGARTLLIDSAPGAGGTGGFSGLTTLCGLYDDAGGFINGGIAREFAEAVAETKPFKMGRLYVLPYRPERFREVAEQWFAKTPNLRTQWSTPVVSVCVEKGRIARLNDFAVGAVIDCSGTAEVARAAGLECLATNETTQAPAVVFPLRNVTCDLLTPADAVQVLMPLVRAGFPPLHFQPHPEPGCITAKFTGPPEQLAAVVAFLRANARGFENCKGPSTPPVVARRAGRMIKGRHVLTGAEVLGAKKFPKAAARCAWPIEQWGPDGRPRLRYLPAGEYYEIPEDSLRAATVANLFMAGKTISADAEAIASARVMGCCLATGEAAGRLAPEFAVSTRQ